MRRHVGVEGRVRIQLPAHVKVPQMGIATDDVEPFEPAVPCLSHAKEEPLSAGSEPAVAGCASMHL